MELGILSKTWEIRRSMLLILSVICVMCFSNVAIRSLSSWSFIFTSGVGWQRTKGWHQLCSVTFLSESLSEKAQDVLDCSPLLHSVHISVKAVRKYQTDVDNGQIINRPLHVTHAQTGAFTCFLQYCCSAPYDQYIVACLHRSSWIILQLPVELHQA